MTLTTTRSCAALVMDTIPLVMRSIHSEMRRRRHVELTDPQFRALMFINRHPGASLSLLAARSGSSLSSASKLVDGLVGHGFVARDIVPQDRRRVTLSLTKDGKRVLELMRERAVSHLAEVLGQLSDGERADLARGMEALRRALADRTTPDGRAECGGQ